MGSTSLVYLANLSFPVDVEHFKTQLFLTTLAVKQFTLQIFIQTLLAWLFLALSPQYPLFCRGSTPIPSTPRKRARFLNNAFMWSVVRKPLAFDFAHFESYACHPFCKKKLLHCALLNGASHGRISYCVLTHNLICG